jgi:GAF domain-containing protein
MEIGTEEAARLATLIEYDILDSEAEEAFDRIAAMAADLFQVPIAAVSLLDGYRQWFKSRVGWSVQELPREHVFCAHTIRGQGVLVVADAAKDRRFAASPLVTKAPSIRFYAGAPLLTSAGQALGTIFVMDRRARRLLTAREKRTLQQLAAMAMEQIELRRLVRTAKAGVQRALRLAGAKSPAYAECQKAMQALRELQALAVRTARKRTRVITPDKVLARRRGQPGGAAAERRAERRRRARA